MDHICKAPCHTSLTNLISQLHQKTMLVCPFVDEHYSILVLQLDQRQTSFNQHKPACWSFQHMCWWKVSLWVLPTAELFGRLRAVWHIHVECSNSYGKKIFQSWNSMLMPSSNTLTEPGTTLIWDRESLQGYSISVTRTPGRWKSLTIRTKERRKHLSIQLFWENIL